LPIESDLPGIEFAQVSKRFQLQEGRTLREFVPALLRGRAWSPPFYALRDVSFRVARGETLGIIGRNGSGKSTILKLMIGLYEPVAGEIFIDGNDIVGAEGDERKKLLN